MVGKRQPPFGTPPEISNIGSFTPDPQQAPSLAAHITSYLRRGVSHKSHMFYSNPYRRTSVSSGGKSATRQAEGGCGRAGWVFKFEPFNQVVQELRRFGEVGCVSLGCAHFIVSGGGIEGPSEDGRCWRVNAENANANEE
jgi:hypothetical protein